MDILPSTISLRQVFTTGSGIAAVGAGADWSFTVPALEEFGLGAFLVKSVQAQLATDSTANQQPVLVITDASGNVISESVGATTAQAASTTCNYSWSPNFVQSGLQGTLTDVHSQGPLPLGAECLLLPSWVVKVHTIGLHSGSQWSGVVTYGLRVG